MCVSLCGVMTKHTMLFKSIKGDRFFRWDLFKSSCTTLLYLHHWCDWSLSCCVRLKFSNESTAQYSLLSKSITSNVSVIRWGCGVSCREMWQQVIPPSQALGWRLSASVFEWPECQWVLLPFCCALCTVWGQAGVFFSARLSETGLRQSCSSRLLLQLLWASTVRASRAVCVWTRGKTSSLRWWTEVMAYPQQDDEAAHCVNQWMNDALHPNRNIYSRTFMLIASDGNLDKIFLVASCCSSQWCGTSWCRRDTLEHHLLC